MKFICYQNYACMFCKNIPNRQKSDLHATKLYANSSLSNQQIKQETFHTSTNLANTAVALRKFLQTCHAVFFPRPANIDTVSQPVTENQNGRALQTSSFKHSAYLCMGNIFDVARYQILSKVLPSSKKRNDIVK